MNSISTKNILCLRVVRHDAFVDEASKISNETNNRSRNVCHNENFAISQLEIYFKVNRTENYEHTTQQHMCVLNGW